MTHGRHMLFSTCVLVGLLVVQQAAWANPNVQQSKDLFAQGAYNEARTGLIRLVEADGGQDADVWFLLARTEHALANLTEARKAIDRAVLYGEKSQVRNLEKMRKFMTYLYDGYAQIEVASSKPTKMVVEGEINNRPDFERYMSSLRANLEKKQEVPARFGLPPGPWTINGVEIVVVGGEPSRVSVPPVQSKTRLGVGPMLMLSLGPGNAHRGPAVGGRLQVDIPTSDMFWLGVGLGGQRQGYQTGPDSAAGAGVGVDGVLSLGPQFGDDGPYALPRVRARYVLGAGMRASCQPSGCDVPPDEVVSQHGVGAGVELGLGWQPGPWGVRLTPSVDLITSINEGSFRPAIQPSATLLLERSL